MTLGGPPTWYPQATAVAADAVDTVNDLGDLSDPDSVEMLRFLVGELVWLAGCRRAWP